MGRLLAPGAFDRQRKALKRGTETMAYLYVRHRVADFDRWLRVFDSHAEAQKEAGFGDVQILREANDPEVVVLFFQVEDLEKARAFTSSPEAEKGKEDSGVIGEPEALWLEEM